MSTATVEFKVAGKSFQFSTNDQDAQALGQAAEQLQAQITQLKSKNPKAKTDELLAMAALELSHQKVLGKTDEATPKRRQRAVLANSQSWGSTSIAFPPAKRKTDEKR